MTNTPWGSSQCGRSSCWSQYGGDSPADHFEAPAMDHGWKTRRNTHEHRTKNSIFPYFPPWFFSGNQQSNTFSKDNQLWWVSNFYFKNLCLVALPKPGRTLGLDATSQCRPLFEGLDESCVPNGWHSSAWPRQRSPFLRLLDGSPRGC